MQKENQEQTKNQQINNIPLRSKPLSSYKKPTLIGLQNIGQPTYINAVLQCLSQTEDLTNYFLDKKSLKQILNNNIAINNRDELQLSPVYFQLLDKLWDSNNFKGCYNPIRFMKTIKEMNPLFQLGQCGDSKDFIIFVLEQFHKELKEIYNDNNYFNFNEYVDKNNEFNHFIQSFSKSIISDIFFGISESTNICLFCKDNFNKKGKSVPICYNYMTFNCIIFPLQKFKLMKEENCKKIDYINSNQINELTLMDCFNFYQKPELFTGADRNYCNKCKQIWDSFYIYRIFSFPKVLIIILSRFRNNNNVKINFTEIIDITQFASLKNGKNIYYLYGVVSKFGENFPNYHYVAFCKNIIDDKWYKYDDAVVTEVNNFQKEIVDFGKPCILFYKKMK